MNELLKNKNIEVMNSHQKYTGFIILILSIIFWHPPNLLAQEEIDIDADLVRWSPDGMVVFASDAALSPENPQDGRIQSVIYRRIGEDSEFNEVARLHRASSWEEFKERAGDTLVQSLQSNTGLTSEEELWDYIQQNPNIAEYGFIALNKVFWKAFGTAFIDEQSKSFQAGQEVTYQVHHIMEDGSVADTLMQGTDYVGNQPNISKPRGVRAIEDDSLAGGRWISSLEGSEDAFFGRVYRQAHPDGEFKRLPNLALAQRIGTLEDSVVVYNWSQTVEPDQAFRYFIEPIDVVGNPGPKSDTLMAISVDFNNLPLMGNAAAKDTTSGIHLSWDPVPNKPYISGIEIQRSRRADQGFVTLDTLNVATTEYLDTQLVPNQTYYYRFRIVSVRESDDLPSAVASAAFRNEDLPPSTPYGLRAEQEEEGIRLTWNSVEEPDLFGYYVYRGTSRQDSMAVISRAIKDTTTFFDNSPELHGRTNYVYAVKAVNMSELVSDFSNRVAIRPNRVVRPPSPVGIEGYAEQKRIRLFWKDQTSRDRSVDGYHVYRSTTPMEITPDSAAATIQAEQTGFERITENLISSSAFDDKNVESGETYYYAVSSVDVFGEESVLSNTARFTTARPDLRPPSRVNVRSITDGVEIHWNRSLQNGINRYRIYRRERGADTASLITDLPPEETRFTDQNVSPGIVYWYSVQVIGEQEASQRSTEISIHLRE